MLLPFAVQRSVLFAVAAIATVSIPRFQDQWSAVPTSVLIDGWLRQDAGQYLAIAQDGYADPITARFFPGYPWLIRAVGLVMPLSYAALFVTNVAAATGLCFFYRFALDVSDERTARRATWLLMLFPWSFFLSAAYSESTYLLATSLTLLGWSRRRPGWAFWGVLLGTLARPVGGICLTLPFLVDWAWNSRRLRDAPWFTLSALLAAAVLLANHKLASGDPLAFVRAGVDAAYGVFAQQKAVNWLQTLWSEGVGPQLVRRVSNFCVLALAAVSAAVLFRRRHVALATMTATSVLVPLLIQRTLFDATSMGRYLLGAPPFALVLASWAPEGGRSRWVDVAFSMLQAAFVMAFAAWVWVE